MVEVELGDVVVSSLVLLRLLVLHWLVVCVDRVLLLQMVVLRVDVHMHRWVMLVLVLVNGALAGWVLVGHVLGTIPVRVHAVRVILIPAMRLVEVAIAPEIVPVIVLIATFVERLWGILLVVIGLFTVGADLKDVAEDFVFFPVSRLLNVDLVNAHFDSFQGRGSH